MGTHVFRLVVASAIDDEGANRLFESGIDDGVPETGPGGHSIGFDRAASSLREAVLSAIAAVESAGFEVLRAEPDDLVSASDISKRTGRSRQSISSLISGTRGPGNWPRPIAGNVRSPLWRWNDVTSWFHDFEGTQSVDRDDAALIAAVNEVLAARRALRHVDRNSRRLLVRRLVS